MERNLRYEVMILFGKSFCVFKDNERYEASNLLLNQFYRLKN